jgi:hypothetical protein
MQAICDHLMYERAENRRQLRRVSFVWVERDPVMMEETDFIQRRASSSIRTMDSNESANLPYHHTLEDPGPEVSSSSSIAAQLLTLPALMTTDEELEVIYGSTDLLLDEYEGNEIERTKHAKVSTFGDLPPAHSTTSCEGEPQPVQHEKAQVLDMQVYLTANTPSVKGVPFAQLGRPNINELFLETKREAVAAGDTRVAVCVSAPRKLKDICRKACMVYSDNKIRFDFHSESMAL